MPSLYTQLMVTSALHHSKVYYLYTHSLWSSQSHTHTHTQRHTDTTKMTRTLKLTVSVSHNLTHTHTHRQECSLDVSTGHLGGIKRESEDFWVNSSDTWLSDPHPHTHTHKGVQDKERERGWERERERERETILVSLQTCSLVEIYFFWDSYMHSIESANTFSLIRSWGKNVSNLTPSPWIASVFSWDLQIQSKWEINRHLGKGK